MIRCVAALLLWLLPAPGSAAPLVAAHRGLVEPGTTENSIEAIRAAVDAGVDVVEIDLRTTADGVIILVHDATVSRVTTGRGSVAQLTLARIRALALKAGSGRITTFEEALDATRGRATKLLLDLKQPGRIDPRQILALAETRSALDQLIIGARSVADVQAYRRLKPSLPILGFIESQSDMEEFVAAGVDAIRLWPRWIAQPRAGCAGGASPSCIVQRLQARRLRVWTVADAPSADETARDCLQWLASLEPDAILTNQPLLARAMPASNARSPIPDSRRCTK